MIHLATNNFSDGEDSLDLDSLKWANIAFSKKGSKQGHVKFISNKIFLKKSLDKGSCVISGVHFLKNLMM